MKNNMITSEQIRTFFRRESAILLSEHDLNSIEPMQLTYDDLQTAMVHFCYDETDIKECSEQWLSPLIFTGDRLGLPVLLGMPNKKTIAIFYQQLEPAISISQAGVLCAVLSSLVQASIDGAHDPEAFGMYADLMQRAKENTKRKPVDYDLEDFQKEDFITDVYDHNIIDFLPDDFKEAYQKWLLEYVNKDFEYAKGIYATSLIGDSTLFQTDTVKAAELFKDLAQNNENVTAAEEFACLEATGCRGVREPNYEEALPYFTIGASAGHLLSRCWLAEMLAKGNGIPRSQEAAGNLLCKTYIEAKKRFIHGSLSEPFPESALRMSEFAESGFIQPSGVTAAWEYLIEAELGMRIRSRYVQSETESDLMNQIDSKRDQLEPLVKLQRRYFWVCDARPILKIIEQSETAQVTVHIRKNYTDLIIEHPFGAHNFMGYVISAGETGQCELAKRAVFRFKSFWSEELTKGAQILADHIEYDPDVDLYNIYYCGVMIASFNGSAYSIVQLPHHKPEDLHQYVCVYRVETAEHIECECSLKGIAHGDKVLVKEGDKQYEACVDTVFHAYPNELDENPPQVMKRLSVHFYA